MEVMESPGIGLYAEKGLHAELKKLYSKVPGARQEVKLAGKIVDVLLPDEIIEIQTRNLASITEKLLHLACYMPVRLVHPIITEIIIVHLSPTDGTLKDGRRVITKRSIFSLFDELVYAPLLIASPNISFDVLLVKVKETRIADGSGSRRHRGVRVLSRELLEIVDAKKLEKRSDWLGLPGASSKRPYDSLSLGASLGIGTEKARKLLYAFSRAGLLVPAGMDGRKKLYDLAEY